LYISSLPLIPLSSVRVGKLTKKRLILLMICSHSWFDPKGLLVLPRRYFRVPSPLRAAHYCSASTVMGLFPVPKCHGPRITRPYPFFFCLERLQVLGLFSSFLFTLVFPLSFHVLYSHGNLTGLTAIPFLTFPTKPFVLPAFKKEGCATPPTCLGPCTFSLQRSYLVRFLSVTGLFFLVFPFHSLREGHFNQFDSSPKKVAFPLFPSFPPFLSRFGARRPTSAFLVSPFTSPFL